MPVFRVARQAQRSAWRWSGIVGLLVSGRRLVLQVVEVAHLHELARMGSWAEARCIERERHKAGGKALVDCCPYAYGRDYCYRSRKCSI